MNDHPRMVHRSTRKRPRFLYHQTESAIKQMLETAPDGSRHIIFIAWKNGLSSHGFIAEKENGVVRYVDPQSGKMDVSDYFARGIADKFGILRIDDKELTNDPVVINAVMK